MKVGFVGIGSMGLGMVSNLLKAGHEVVAYDIRREAVEEALSRGAQAAISAAEVARVAGVQSIHSCVTSPAAVEQVYFGSEGLIESASGKQVLVDHSTVSPFLSRRIHEAAAERGIEFLDAPISGGVVGAVDGTLSIMVGGSEAALGKVRPLFEATGENIYHMGEAGSGSAIKLVNNLILAVNLVAISEGMVMAEKAGIDMAKAVEVLLSGAARSWALEQGAAHIASSDYSYGGNLDILVKDLGLITQFGNELEVPQMLTAITHQIFKTAHVKGYGGQHSSGVIRVLQDMVKK